MLSKEDKAPFFKKYRPKSSREVQGQDKAVEQLANFVKNYKRSKTRCAILYGPSGVGKTCSVHALANDLNFEIVEINASDFRNADHIDSILGSASKQLSLFAKSKLILVDEIDGLSGTKDRGGIQALMKLLPESSFPIICTCQNPYDEKFSSLRQKCELIQFHPLSYLSIFNMLKEISDKECLKYEDDVLKSISRRAGGDLRAAINDIQMLTSTGSLEKDDLNMLDDRDKVESMLTALIKIFKNSDARIALEAFDSVDEDIDKQMLWIDENLPKEYLDPEALANAYDSLSKADVFRGRIRRWQHWRFLVYVNTHISAGIATSKKEKNKSYVCYTPTSRIFKIWQANMKYQKRKAIAEKVAGKTHCSRYISLHDTLPSLQAIYKKNPDMASKLTEEFNFSDDEVEWLKK